MANKNASFLTNLPYHRFIVLGIVLGPVPKKKSISTFLVVVIQPRVDTANSKYLEHLVDPRDTRHLVH